VLSAISWKTNRERHYRPEILDLVKKDIAALAPEHVAVTGDLCNLSLLQEFDQARDWLKSVGDPHHVTVIAGNHDALIASPQIANGFAEWRPWMSADENAFGSPTFPFVRQRGEIALIGVNTAVPSGPFMATGRVGARQLKNLRDTLLSLGGKNHCRIVLIHHPITDDAEPERKQLQDRVQLRAILRETGAELVLHGHTHKSAFRTVPGPDGDIPVIGVPSASATSSSPERRAGWNLISIEWKGEGKKAGWHIDISARRLKDGIMFESEEHSYLQ
jgi:3',5'-cyclic AMP phosphodiesterase CpdA